ncbi:retinitis pigmentosa 1-like 1 protein [Xiphias gladius]|uniref:retinitis pigmentosa 1-like 1 protein n=1 Tax=Xiphias gladius TaxID=8245 RepID=UPI001A9A199A|nr:retinitis pigmentosa 1-like 1 protein [Xiphias gladius]
MHSVQAGMWDPRPPSKHASPHPVPPPSNLRLARATPAKRITFYRSGDSQFGGVRMAIHKRSFKCFDALLDDLSQKVPLPFGVRTVTTPRGTNTIRHLEQLQDGGCYLCSDRRHAKPINMELASKRPSIWYHHSRRPQRPETSSATPPGHFPYRQRRILLVKNSEPGMRRSVVLGRRTRSLRAFLDEVSEVMQFHVRKLYTAEGRRIDSVQSLITCPGVLVCVGREPFSPMLVNFIKKSSEEKLPGLGSRSPGLGPRTPGNGARSPAAQGARSPPHGGQSRASEYSEGHESKKNVNFGLETKKSIIHPRSDSSNRSTRFSLSSEKSYSNGISTCSQARPAIMNDDIEKRVLVNKDGSLSVEMRVRFRLHNDETIQWSTQIKKSPSLSNECCPLSQVQPHYLQQGQSESCSDPDSMLFDPEGVDYSNQPLQHALEANHCPCCYQRQEQQYDLWENPAHSHKQPLVPPPHPRTSSHTRTMMRHTHSSSSSSSCNSRRVVRCRAKLSSCGGGLGSEQSQLVQEEMCVTEQVERRVEVEQDGETHVEVCRVSRCCSRSEVIAMDSNTRPLSSRSVEDELLMEEEGGRPMSAVSSSSHVLQSLKEDQDDEDDDLPPSASQCCHSNESSPSPTSERHLIDKPKSNVSAGSINCIEHKKHKDGEERRSRAVSAASSCQCGAVTPHSTAEAEEIDQALSSKSKMSRASCRSSKAKTPHSEEEGSADDEDEEIKRDVSVLSGHTGLSAGSQKSGESSVCPNCGGCKRRRTPSAMSAQSNLSVKSKKSHKSNCKNAVDRAISSLSAKSGVSAKTSASVKSHKSNCPLSTKIAVEDDDINKRAPSSLSVKSNASAKSGRAESPDSALSVKSTKSNVTAKSSTSHRSACSHCAKAVSPGAKIADEPIKATEQVEETEGEERAASDMSDKSNLSFKSNKSPKSTKALERSLSPSSEAEGDGEERPATQMSAGSVHSNMSVKSSKSYKSNFNGNETVASPSLKIEEEAEEKENEQRPESAISAKLEKEERAASARSSRSHKSNCNGNTGASSIRQDNTEDVENAKDWAASTLCGKSASSPNSQHSNTDVDGMVNRTPSAMSGKSHTSSKSSKFQKSDHSAASTNKDEKQNESQERVASAMSVQSKSSVRSSTSHKSNPSKNLKSVSPGPNVVTNNTSEGVDEEGNEATERAPSTASAKSEKSNVSPNHSGTAVIETEDADEKIVEDSAPRSKSSECSLGQTLSPKTTRSPRTRSPKVPAASPSSPQSSVQKLLPGPSVRETRGPSALSVHSTTSAKSGRSKCHCGAASALEKEGEDKEEASEKAASILSSSSKRQRKESGGTEQPLSRQSSGSVSLGLPEDQETADSDSRKSTVSFHTNTDSKSRNNGNKSTLSQNLPAVDIPTIETPRGGEDEESGGQKTERAASALSAKTSRSHKSSCNCSFKAAAHMLDSKPKEQHASVGPTGNDLETESVKSASTSKASNLDAPDNRTSSAISSASAKVRKKSPANSANNYNENQNISRPASEAKGKEDISEDKKASVHSKSPCCLRPESAFSAQSGSKMKASKQSKGEDSVKSDNLTSVKGQKAKSNVGSDCGSFKTSSSQKKEALIKPSNPCPLHSSRLCSKVDTCSESTLLHSLSAADLLKETIATCPHSRQSKASKSSDKTRSEKSARCQRIRNQKDMKDEQELTPACLPNASPNEVVSDWLRSIPANSSMLALGEELNESEQKDLEDKPGEEVGKEGESPEDENVDKEEKTEAEEGKSSDPAPNDAVGTSSHPNTLLLSGNSQPRNWHSSVAVMKVLLSSSLGRCRSMPEVSPVYGRRLSTSARGLLDCLAQLQLIEPAVSPGCDQQKDRNQQYEDIMGILQSLWLTEPRQSETKKVKDVGKEQVTPPRSSSGVDMSSGSGGSGKENGNQGGDETPAKETESLHEDEGAEKVVKEDEERNAEAGDKEIEAEPEETTTEQETTDIAEEQLQGEEQSTVPPSLDSPKATENPSSSDKSSGNDSSKSPTDNEQETLEDSSSSTPPTVLRAPLSKRLSQDPDPVWVLHLLKKLEKQFINHYINAMAEFKVRWDLDDSLVLDTMISELRDEVSRRIQSSVEREMRKIQSRAGRGGRIPRPPQGGNLSRESTMTEKRRQMLKVMKNQSVKTADSLSDGEMTGDFSDQRSDDEYCPCDACVRKKMAARPLKINPMAAEAPVMMEFDLLKILQLKKSPLPATAAKPQSVDVEGDIVISDEEGRNLEVVREEEEEDETKEDIKAEVVLEETIPEEGEEIGQEEDWVEAGEEEEIEAEKEENGVGEEVLEEGQTGGEETGEEEASYARNEEESDKAKEEEEAEETSDNTGEDKSADDEETGGEEERENVDDEEETGENETLDNEGETGTGEEDSDNETVRDATAGEGEIIENGEKEEAEVQECEVSDFKPEEEETTGRNHGKEEEIGEIDDDTAGRNAANEESTLVEEFVEGNVSASTEAEDEDDGNDATGEGESHEDGKGRKSEEQEMESAEEETASPQDQGAAPAVCVTEGEEADAEDSDTDNKHPSDTSADESGRDGAGTPGDEEIEGGRDGVEEEVVGDAVEEFKPEEEDEEAVNSNKRVVGALLHQFTRTSVECQLGSLEDIDMDSRLNPVSSVEVPKTGVSTGGGTSQRRSRSAARDKRRKPKESDVELDNF